MTGASPSQTTTADPRSPSSSVDTAPCTLQEFLLYFLRLGTFGFGGSIAGAAFVLSKRVITNFPTVLIALATLGVLSTVRKVPESLLILAAGVVGLLVQWAAHT
jgi:hypothetical protein